MIDLILNEASSSTNATPYDLRPKLWGMPSEILARIVQLTPRENRQTIIGTCKNFTQRVIIQVAIRANISEELNDMENFILDEIINNLIKKDFNHFVQIIDELKNLTVAMKKLPYVGWNDHKQNREHTETALICILSRISVSFSSLNIKTSSNLKSFANLKSCALLHNNFNLFINSFRVDVLIGSTNLTANFNGITKVANASFDDIRRFIQQAKKAETFTPPQIAEMVLRYPIYNFEIAKIAICVLTEAANVTSEPTFYRDHFRYYTAIINYFIKEEYFLEAFQIVNYVSSMIPKKLLIDTNGYVEIILLFIEAECFAEALQLIEKLDFERAPEEPLLGPPLIGSCLDIVMALAENKFFKSAIELLSRITVSFNHTSVDSKLIKVADLFYNTSGLKETLNFKEATKHIFGISSSDEGVQTALARVSKIIMSFPNSSELGTEMDEYELSCLYRSKLNCN